MRLMRTDLDKKEILVRVKYKINSYKIGFCTVLQSNLQLHKNEEHLNQSSFRSLLIRLHSRVKFKTFCTN